MNTELEDIEMVKKAKLSPELESAAELAVTSLHFLRELAQAKGISLDQLTAEHIIRCVSELDAALEKNKQLFSA